MSKGAARANRSAKRAANKLADETPALAVDDIVQTSQRGIVPLGHGRDAPALGIGSNPYSVNRHLDSNRDVDSRFQNLPEVQSVHKQLQLINNTSAAIAPFSASLLANTFTKGSPMNTCSFNDCPRVFAKVADHIEVSRPVDDTATYSDVCGACCRTVTPPECLVFADALKAKLNALAKDVTPTGKIGQVHAAGVLLVCESFRVEGGDRPNKWKFVCLSTGIGKWYRFEAKCLFLEYRPDPGFEAGILALPNPTNIG